MLLWISSFLSVHFLYKFLLLPSKLPRIQSIFLLFMKIGYLLHTMLPLLKRRETS